MKIGPAVTVLMVGGALGFGQAPQTASIKMMDGTQVQGAIAGQVAFQQGFGTGGGLVAGADIEAITEKGLQIRSGAAILQTFLPLSNRPSLMKNPPYTLILQNVTVKKPPTPATLGLVFEAPCDAFADSSCDKVKVVVNLASGTNTASVPLSAARVLGEFRVQDGVATIDPVLMVAGPGGQIAKVDVTLIAPGVKPAK